MMPSPTVDHNAMVTKSIMAMWRAVVHMAIADARNKAHKDILAHREALRWIECGGNDFYLVCELAGYCPMYVRDRFKKANDRISKRGGNYKR